MLQGISNTLRGQRGQCGQVCVEVLECAWPRSDATQHSTQGGLAHAMSLTDVPRPARQVHSVSENWNAFERGYEDLLKSPARHTCRAAQLQRNSAAADQLQHASGFGLLWLMLGRSKI